MRAGALEAMTWIEPERALAAAESLPGNLGQSLRRTALMSMAQDDPLAALRHVETLAPSGDRDMLLNMIAQSYGRTDPAAAIAWAQTMPPQLLTVVMFGVARSDPERAIELLLTLPSGAEQERAHPLARHERRYELEPNGGARGPSAGAGEPQPRTADADERVGATQSRRSAELAARESQPHFGGHHRASRHEPRPHESGRRHRLLRSHPERAATELARAPSPRATRRTMRARRRAG